MRRRDDFVLGMLLGASLLVPWSNAVSAHNPGTYFSPLVFWDNHQDIDYKIDDSIPGTNGSAFEDRISDGAGAWNAVTGVNGFTFDDMGNSSTNWADPCTWENSAAVDIRVFYRDLAVPGVSLLCVRYDSQIGAYYSTAGRMGFNDDNSVTWYTGTGNVPAGEVSVEEVALHELGHLTGTFYNGAYEGHWQPEPSFACALGGAESDFTMCPLVTPGKSYLLPLDAHDIDTFQNAY